MKPSLYLETTVVSYLTARPSRDLVTAARQQLTSDWWEFRRQDYDIFVSPLVLEEAERGDPAAAEARMSVLRGLKVEPVNAEAYDLVDHLMREVSLSATVVNDAIHIACAATSGAEFLMTWNFKHIANPVLRDKIGSACRQAGYEPAVICTPEELLEGAEE
ncbi:MAG: type II toxin-antitoxin system VapC family toxin [Thermoanaerobaculia bacterium]|nr:type II toxin-antitoxin system VapC family toxin [Thermoanaerobaculia bacterium]